MDALVNSEFRVSLFLPYSSYYVRGTILTRERVSASDLCSLKVSSHSNLDKRRVSRSVVVVLLCAFVSQLSLFLLAPYSRTEIIDFQTSLNLKYRSSSIRFYGLLIFIEFYRLNSQSDVYSNRS